jgi:alpha-D-ribose 1-methylphosphonate 5-triphosphate synthase subunit PhnL
VLLLDEPTAALDAESRQVVMELIGEAREHGAAVLGTVHDAEVRARLATRVETLGPPVAA